MTRGIQLKAPSWAKRHLTARKAVYFKAVKEQAKKAQAALPAGEKEDRLPAEATDASPATGTQEDKLTDKQGLATSEEQEEGNAVAVVAEQVKNEDVEDDGEDSKTDEDDSCSWYIDLGRGDFWPCYLRYMFIAAYRMIRLEWSDEVVAAEPQVISSSANSLALVPLKPPKELVLETILRVCPRLTASIPPSSHTKKVNDLLSRFQMGYGLASMMPEHGSLHLAMCAEDEEVISVLVAAGLGPLCDMCRDHHKFIEVLDTERICKVTALLNKLKPYFSLCAEDIAGTPFADAHPSYENVDENNSLVEILETFSEVASLDCGVTGFIE